MTVTPVYGPVDNDEALRTLKRTIELGSTFWDTADLYGFGSSERFLSEELKRNRNGIFICTKFGNAYRMPEPGFKGNFASLITGIRGDPEYVRASVEGSLERLGVDRIDLYYQHRVDPNTPIEKTVAAMAELVKEGKVRYLGLSECSADTLRRAYKVHPIAAVQMEYSPWTIDIETNGLLDACRELGVTLVAYSPLGRGFLTGQIRKFEDLPERDWRRTNPRFQPENFAHNIKLVEGFERIAAKKGVKPGQLALAWLLAQVDNLIVIPGTKRVKYLEENVAAAQIKLTEEEIEEIRELVDKANVKGERYDEVQMKLVDA
ncbi:aldo/keto reductase [Linderina pennispora]|uniref:Aldo/keto reductase n=1 Tax=Linderina pennispora TaxID=61395 RepID=A0A1Y1VYW7_9FUNG|nr:aldo/keto reductase [Linderina pennispora]ORX66225.1 aldo/keto reductase [Linderina pennispora]